MQAKCFNFAYQCVSLTGVELTATMVDYEDEDRIGACLFKTLQTFITCDYIQNVLVVSLNI